jgi:hypothetical protein
MAQSNFQHFSPRDYLETYYPSDIDPASFASAIEEVSARYDDATESRLLDIAALSKKTGLSTEVIENAALFDFFRDLSRDFLKEFPEGNAVVLDIGGGPTIYQYLSLSLAVQAIIHAEYLLENRKEIAAFVTNDESAYSWAPYFYAVKSLLSQDKEFQEQLTQLASDPAEKVRAHAFEIQRILNSQTEVREFEIALKRKVAQRLVPCDVFQSNLEADSRNLIAYSLLECGKITGHPDIIMSCFVVESATSHEETWRQGIKNLANALEIGGYLVMTAIRNANWYKVGDNKIAAFPVNEERLQQVFRQYGLRVKDLRVLVGSDDAEDGYDGMILICAQKIK